MHTPYKCITHKILYNRRETGRVDVCAIDGDDVDDDLESFRRRSDTEQERELERVSVSVCLRIIE